VEVRQLTARGMTNADIAQRLFISKATVKTICWAHSASSASRPGPPR